MPSIILNGRESVVELDTCNQGLDQVVEAATAHGLVLHSRFPIIKARDRRIAHCTFALLTSRLIPVWDVFVKVCVKLLCNLAPLQLLLALGTLRIDESVLVEIVLVLIVVGEDARRVCLLIHCDTGHAVQNSLTLLIACRLLGLRSNHLIWLKGLHL